VKVRTAAVLAILVVASSFALHAQSAAAAVSTWQATVFPAPGFFPLDGQPVAPPTPPAAQRTPEPYTEDEFPQWARDVWRGGVIFVGSLPFTFFFTLEGYDVYRWTASGFGVSSAPWPFRPASDIKYTAEEQVWLIVGALTASFLVSGADYLIGIFSENR
jgi:hypothetical protein